MAITKQKKQEIVASVKDILNTSKSVVFVNFHKLPVSESTTIRKELRSKDVNFTVAKKTLTKRALTEAAYSGEIPKLDGELALVYSADLLAPAREIYDFQKKLDGRVSILGGVFNGLYKNKEEMESIALIPSQKTLYAQFVNIINSPIQGFVLALNAIAEKKQ
ncbi:MAG: 50S ribosomal protein L10 [Candidatus Pacebacteria bacterium]|nr:50S ribosomal protein L10 [Candidatus Paceibacterota bacterium]